MVCYLLRFLVAFLVLVGRTEVPSDFFVRLEVFFSLLSFGGRPRRLGFSLAFSDFSDSDLGGRPRRFLGFSDSVGWLTTGSTIACLADSGVV